MAREPEIKRSSTPAPSAGSASSVDQFLAKAKAVTPAPPPPGAGRLIFAMDATMSRQPTWDMACALQGRMFEACAELGGLGVQLVYFRGMGECRASSWVGDPTRLTQMMGRIACQGGQTQIGRVLAHVRDEARRAPVRAFVFVGDAMEEHADTLCQTAGELGLVGVKGFIFQEGGDASASATFREIARLTGGAYARFDSGSAGQLLALLRGAAAYAAAGRRGLEALASRESEARALLTQMNKGR